MRSLTQSSASPFPASHPLPHQEPTLASQTRELIPAHINHFATLVHPRPKPTTPSPNQHPFFNITNKTNIVSARARHHISQAI